MSRTHRRKKFLLRKFGNKGRKKFSWNRYSTHRHDKETNPRNLDHYKSFEAMTSSRWSSLDYTLIERWLFHQIGRSFDDIYSDWLDRIQPKHKDRCRHVLLWFVETNTILGEDGVIYAHDNYLDIVRIVKGYYIHPETHILCRVPDRPSERKLRKKSILRWKNDVLERDCHQCVVCKSKVKVHPYCIMPDKHDFNGYRLGNGACLCKKHYRKLQESRLYRNTHETHYGGEGLMKYEDYLYRCIKSSYVSLI